MTKKLSATMAIALAEARDHGGELVRWQGGFWTYPGCPSERASWPKGEAIPTWWITAHTINALLDRGQITIAERHPHYGFTTKVRLVEQVL